MPEYLAPGVYVEETSFRARSIEGVSTSTTAFVGPTRKGPVNGQLELLTSFGDFERIYGGLDDLILDGKRVTNYVAHAVRSYFDEGGSRLYVSRVYGGLNGVMPPVGRIEIIPNANVDQRVVLASRFLGDSGNGTSTITALAAPASQRALDSSPVGSLLRVGGDTPAGPASVTGGTPTFVIPDGGVLLLTVSGTNLPNITFRGLPNEATAQTAVANPLTLDNVSNVPLQVVIDGVSQTISIPNGNYTPDQLVQLVNVGLAGGYARTDAGRLVIGSDRRGSGGSVVVRVAAPFGFTAQQSVRGSDNATNNVADLQHVTAAEINSAVTAATAALPAAQQVQAGLTPDGHLMIATVATGSAATLAVRDGPNSVAAALGLPVGQPAAAGTQGASMTYYTKSASGVWQDVANNPLPANALQASHGQILTMSVTATDKDGHSIIYDDLGFSPLHPRWAGFVLADQPTRRAELLENPVAMEIGAQVTPQALRAALVPDGTSGRSLTLLGGSDGPTPTATDYGKALVALEKLDDVSIVAAPGSSQLPDAQAIWNALITHVEKPRAYRIAVLDTPPGQTPGQVRDLRGQIDSTRAAVYYPWVIVPNPLYRTGREDIPREIPLPPSGFVCGVYARTDDERGVWKAPANEVVRSALRFEQDINFALQGMLNPLGINCLRYMTGRGYRVWGARTATSDPEWKYVNIRRYFNYLESSIDRGMQWAVFEPNGERLWASIRDTVSDFLYNEWVSGALLGSSAQEAFFVRCDRSTMTQNDLDNGRLICLIGVAAIKPAEFVIFRIGQKTADARA